MFGKSLAEINEISRQQNQKAIQRSAAAGRRGDTPMLSGGLAALGAALGQKFGNYMAGDGLSPAQQKAELEQDTTELVGMLSQRNTPEAKDQLAQIMTEYGKPTEAAKYAEQAKALRQQITLAALPIDKRIAALIELGKYTAASNLARAAGVDLNSIKLKQEIEDKRVATELEQSNDAATAGLSQEEQYQYYINNRQFGKAAEIGQLMSNTTSRKQARLNLSKARQEQKYSSMTDEEKLAFDTLFGNVDKLTQRIDLHKKQTGLFAQAHFTEVLKNTNLKDPAEVQQAYALALGTGLESEAARLQTTLTKLGVKPYKLTEQQKAYQAWANKTITEQPNTLSIAVQTGALNEGFFGKTAPEEKQKFTNNLVRLANLLQLEANHKTYSLPEEQQFKTMPRDSTAYIEDAIRLLNDSGVLDTMGDDGNFKTEVYQKTPNELRELKTNVTSLEQSRGAGERNYTSVEPEKRIPTGRDVNSMNTLMDAVINNENFDLNSWAAVQVGSGKLAEVNKAQTVEGFEWARNNKQLADRLYTMSDNNINTDWKKALDNHRVTGEQTGDYAEYWSMLNAEKLINRIKPNRYDQERLEQRNRFADRAMFEDLIQERKDEIENLKFNKPAGWQEEVDKLTQFIRKYTYDLDALKGQTATGTE